MAEARDFAEQVQNWATQNGYFADFDTAPAAERRAIEEVMPETAVTDRSKAEDLIEKKGITGILFDDDSAVVTILTAGQLGPRNSKILPDRHGNVQVHWIGSAQVQHNPPPLPSQPPVTKRCYLHGGRVACGSSVTAATIFGAGSMGCLIRDGDGDLCGLTNNHVTGGCNHMQAGMPILSPSPLDASPSGPEPRTLGRHKFLIKLDSGNPGAVQPQDYDVATFKIANEDGVSSMQGPNHYDTPGNIGQFTGGQRVKKCGRTTEVTTGTVRGAWLMPIAMPYRSAAFNAIVYLRNMFGVEGDGGKPFSEGGDSGSLVVSEDGTQALGLVVGISGTVSIIMPIWPLFQSENWTLVSNHHI